MDTGTREIKLSSYTSGFNLIKNEFSWKAALSNHSSIVDEVVVAINTSEDGTLEEVIQFAERSDKIKVIETDFSYLDPDLDGKIKNAALQETKYSIKIGLDMDELVDPEFKDRWQTAGAILEESQDIKAFFIPVIDLYKNKYNYKSLGQKWYIHKEGLYRGTVNFARNRDGTHDTNKSDSCELIDENGDLVPSAGMVLVDGTTPDDLTFDNIKDQRVPVVFHLGYLNLRKKILRNKNFWANHWAVEAGREVYVPTEVEEIDFIAREHSLDVSFI